MADHRFELVGGHPALDFLNTIHNWMVPDRRDYLPAFPDAVRFGEAAGVLSKHEARRLGVASPGHELARLRELRTRLERVFRALIIGRAPGPEDLGATARDAGRAAGAARLLRSGRQLTRLIEVEGTGAAALRLRLIEAAVGLLTSPALERVKACPNCGWFFLDSSKNRSRRWCSMATCGNSAKARAYYRRHKRR